MDQNSEASLDVRTTSFMLTFIQRSMFASLPLKVSPFFNSMRTGKSIADFKSDSGNCWINWSQGQQTTFETRHEIAKNVIAHTYHDMYQMLVFTIVCSSPYLRL